MHSDCQRDEVCLTGECRLSCSGDQDCPIERICSSGGCILPDPNARPRCEDDAGCTDAGDAGEVTDAVLSDGIVTPDVGPLTPDAAPLDAAPVETDGDVGATDAVVPDAFVAPDAIPGPVDLSGVYAVRHQVTLTGSRAYAVGDEAHTIATLVFLRGSVYRMEVRDQQGAELFVVPELDFASPDPGTYQFEYPLDDPLPPEGCTRTDERFQRGTFTPDPPHSLDGDEDLRIEFAGEDCAEEDAVVQQRVEWRPVPRP